MLPAHLKSAKELSASKRHGTRTKYVEGCRCLFCTDANSRYFHELKKRQPVEKNGMISASYTWKLINRLLNKGFTEESLSNRLGSRSLLQFKESLITTKNAAKVQELYDLVMHGIGAYDYVFQKKNNKLKVENI